MKYISLRVFLAVMAIATLVAAAGAPDWSGP